MVHILYSGRLNAKLLIAFDIHDLNGVKSNLLCRFVCFKRGGEPYAPKTTKLRLAALNLFLAWCYDKHYVHDNLVISKRKQELMPNQALQNRNSIATTIAILFPDEQKRLLVNTGSNSASSIRNRCLLSLILASGLLSKDILQLKSDALDLTHGYLQLDTTENDTIKKIPIDLRLCGESCAAWLEKRCEIFPDGLRGYLFANKRGEPLTSRALRKIVAKSLTDAGKKSIVAQIFCARARFVICCVTGKA